MANELRRLTAIVAADVAGYSRLVGRDESGTVGRLGVARSELLEPVVSRRGGRIVKLTGDGALMEFSSAVEALSAVIEFQQSMLIAESERPTDERLVFRIGVHSGDVIVQGGDIYGDGVNIAARLEAEAPPGGVIVSGPIFEATVGRVNAEFEDLGRLSLKNIERPIQAYAVRWKPAAWTNIAALQPASAPATSPRATLLPLPDKPSIAVLPFQNMSGDPEQEYFADGMVEDIITALSRISGLFVIARTSSFTYKGRAGDIRQVGRELGVRYDLEGSVRKAANRLRITGQLIEADTGAHLWADRFDSSLEEVFDLQDHVTAAVVSAIEPSLVKAEIRRAGHKPTENLQAYDWWLRALGEQQLLERENVDRAIAMARKALELDPRFGLAYAHLASWIQRRRMYGWMQDEESETAEGIKFAHQAVRLEPSDPIVLTEAAFALGHLNSDLATAIPWLDRAISLNPNSAFAFGRGAIVRNFAGDYDTAERHSERALRLSPYDTVIHAFSKARGDSHLFRGQHEKAIHWLKRSRQENPLHASTHLHLASALAHTGAIEEARGSMKQLLQLRPMSSMSWQRSHRLFPQADYEQMLEGARLAGLPD